MKRISSLVAMIHSILILGAAQGLFLALLLVSKRIGSTANNVLAAAMVAFSVYIASEVYYGQSLFLEYPAFIGMSEPIIFLFGPLIYLYTRIISLGESSFPLKYWLHFLPFFAHLLYLMPTFLMDASAKIDLVEQIMQGRIPLDLWVIGQLRFVHGLTYVVLTFFVIRRHELRIKEQFSHTEKINLRWLRNMLIGSVSVWAVATVLNVLDLANMMTVDLDWLVPLGTSIFIYAIGYMGLRQPEIFGRSAFLPTKQHLPLTSSAPHDGSEPAPGGVALTEPAGTSAQYKRSGLSEEDAEKYLHALLRYMDNDRPFSKSEFTLRDLSDALSISAHNLSEVINTRLGKNFYDFVNGYRIKEVQRKLKDSGYDHLTIVSLAYDAGFNSKSAFNTSFKKITGETPSAYRRKERAGRSSRVRPTG